MSANDWGHADLDDLDTQLTNNAGGTKGALRAQKASSAGIQSESKKKVTRRMSMMSQ